MKIPLPKFNVTQIVMHKNKDLVCNNIIITPILCLNYSVLDEQWQYKIETLTGTKVVFESELEYYFVQNLKI